MTTATLTRRLAATVSTVAAAAAMATGAGVGTASAVDGGIIADSATDSRVSAVAKINSAGLCSGTLIDEQWVLTAAHCIKYLPNGTVGFGEDGQTERRSFNNSFRHPDHNVDLGLILLNEPVTTIEPMGMHSSRDQLALDQTGDIYGWGGDANKEGALHGTSVTVSKLDESRFINLLVRAELVEVTTAAESSSIQGDSGGPLFIDQAGEKNVAGVLSYINSKNRDKPLYTPVYKARTWVDQIMATHDQPTTMGSVNSHLGSVGGGAVDFLGGESVKYIGS